jgi:transcriptional regulator with XRE-family HTH domain
MGFKEIGKKIQQAREERGLTQVDLALALGITQAALSNYELGKRRLYLHQIEEISRVLGKDLEYFIGTDQEASAPRPLKNTPALEKLIGRIRNLNDEDLRTLSEYLDFLAWRKHHG